MDTAAIDRAIAAHARWKYRLFSAVKTGQSEWTVEDIRSHKECEFGKWVASLPSAIRMSPPCQKAMDLHVEFHQVASEVLELVLSGRRAGKKRWVVPGPTHAG